MAHYGLFPDWWEDIRRVGGGAAVRDMARGAEAYLQAWERVYGIGFGCKSARAQRFARWGLAACACATPPPSCCDGEASPRSAATGPGAGACAARRTAARGSRRRSRPGAGWRWWDTRGSERGPRGRGCAGTGHGTHGRRAVRAERGPKARFVYGVRAGRVRFAAVATRAASKDRTALRRYVELAKLR